MSTIRFEQVSKTFADASAPAVDQCSFEVASGSFVVLLGPSGCGKTTLLKMVNRLYEPTTGVITLDGADIREFQVTALRRDIGYVIQQIGLFPHMTVAENIAVVPRLLGWTPERIRARVRELLDLVDLPGEEFFNRYPAQLSGGQQQRVGVARALASDPKVILMDEPFGAIDAITRTVLQDELLALQRKLRKTVLFVTHDVEEALRLADKIIIMRAGRIVQYDTPCAILTRPADAFVYDLVGADDVVRQLSLIRVEQVMVRQVASTGGPCIEATAHLRQALSLLLGAGVEALTVTEDGQAVGALTLDTLRAATQMATPG